MIERISQVVADDGEKFLPGGEIDPGFSVALLFLGQQVRRRFGGGLMMGPAHLGSSVSAESFRVDGFVGGFSFDAQSFVSLRLALGAAPAHVRSVEIARSVGVAATLALGLVGLDSFRIAIDVCLPLRSGPRVAARSVRRDFSTALALR